MQPDSQIMDVMGVEGIYNFPLMVPERTCTKKKKWAVAIAFLLEHPTDFLPSTCIWFSSAIVCTMKIFCFAHKTFFQQILFPFHFSVMFSIEQTDKSGISYSMKLTV